MAISPERYPRSLGWLEGREGGEVQEEHILAIAELTGWPDHVLKDVVGRAIEGDDPDSPISLRSIIQTVVHNWPAAQNLEDEKNALEFVRGWQTLNKVFGPVAQQAILGHPDVDTLQVVRLLEQTKKQRPELRPQGELWEAVKEKFQVGPRDIILHGGKNVVSPFRVVTRSNIPRWIRQPIKRIRERWDVEGLDVGEFKGGQFVAHETPFPRLIDLLGQKWEKLETSGLPEDQVSVAKNVANQWSAYVEKQVLHFQKEPKPIQEV